MLYFLAAFLATIIAIVVLGVLIKEWPAKRIERIRMQEMIKHEKELRLWRGGYNCRHSQMESYKYKKTNDELQIAANLAEAKRIINSKIFKPKND